ncbi:pyruvate kinase [bacterium]|nr:pyruvate kinase [bacterium]
MKDRINTKIVCTMGTRDNRDSVESLKQLIESGMDVVRVNMSHSPHFREEGSFIPGKTYVAAAEQMERIRQAAAMTDRHVAIMGDLMGQKIRIGNFENDEVELKKGEEFILHNDQDKIGDESSVFINHFDVLASAFSPGALFLFSDGLIRMRAKKGPSRESGIILEILDNGILRSRQGVVLKGMSPDLPAFTKKDAEDLKFLMDQKVDMIAVSYVRSAGDIVKIRGLIETSLEPADYPMIIAKIETEGAIEDIHAIACEADGIMVARGDLGVRMDVEDVPVLQKEIIHLCNVLGKPVITATQMLESMIDRPFPTRAEVTDVANAIFDGTDAVMLSGETAIGSYPLETVKMMRRISKKAESARFRELKAEFKKSEWRNRIENGINDLKKEKTYPKGKSRIISDAITLAAAEIVDDIKLNLILTPTRSGHTSRLMSRFRPGVPIVAAVYDERIARKLVLSHGVVPIMVEKRDTVDDSFAEACQKVKDAGLLKDDELFIATSGYPVNVIGSTNLLKIVQA